MAGSFGDKGSGPGTSGKRPVPTIEGTATEVNDKPDTESGSADEEATTETDARKSAVDDDGADEPTETEPEKQSVSAEPPRRRSGAGVISNLVAGFLGGLAGAGALAFAWGYLPNDQPAEPPDLTPLEDRIAKLEAKPESPDNAAANAAALSKLEARVTDLEAQEPKTPPEVAALADRVSQLEASLKSMAEAAKEGGSIADAAAISQQIDEAEQRLEAKIDAALTVAKDANAAPLEALRKEVAALDAKLKALAEAELGSAEVAELIPEIGMLDERLAKLEEAIPTLVTELDQDAADTKAATLAIAFANLRAAVSDGRPYAAELATLAALAPGTGDLGSLLDYEDKGMPTMRELTRTFREAKDAALAAPAADADASLVDRLVASAESLVKIRRVDAEAEGDSLDAVLARAEAQLEQENLAAAVKEVEALQGAQRAAFASWLDQAHARLDAHATLQKLQNILLVSLGGSGEPDQTDEQDAR